MIKIYNDVTIISVTQVDIHVVTNVLNKCDIKLLNLSIKQNNRFLLSKKQNKNKTTHTLFSVGKVK